MKRLVAIFSLLLIVMLLSCNENIKSVEEVSTDFGKYVAAFTSGEISCQSNIQVCLADEYQGEIPDDMTLPEGVFSLTPSVDGKAIWKNRKTIVFIPDHRLKSGATYNVKVNLEKLIKLPKDLQQLEFSVSTYKQAFSVNVEGFQSYSKETMLYLQCKGAVTTSDVINNDDLHQLLRARIKGKKDLPIRWSHNNENTVHYFTIDSIRRIEQSQLLSIMWNGSPIGVNQEGRKVLEIPQLGDFKLLGVRVVQYPQQYVSIRFSDPLKRRQNLRGLFKLAGETDLKTVINGNEVRIYPPSRLIGEKKLFIFSGIKNAANFSLKKKETLNLSFENLKPAVRLLGKGVISPSSQGLTLPFEAVSLRAVELRIIEIYANNIPQFLQDNKINGDSELRRVGRLILKKRIDLEKNRIVDLQRWNAYTIDISKFIKVNAGSIYRAELRFNKKDAYYDCADNNLDKERVVSDFEKQKEQANFKEEQAQWDSPGWYSSYYYPDNYNWRERNNPCDVSYYNSSRFVQRNIFASDLGIIAKCGEDKNVTVAVSNLLTVEPESGVDVEIYSYQHQLLGKATTDGKGMAKIKLDRKPYLLIAKKGKQYGYLRLDDGTALSLSNFDVGGETVQKGIKGCIYGERGVWRPGDKLYLTFVMEDQANRLPLNYPVVFELINPQGQTVEHRVARQGINGFYSFVTQTNADAPTGNWNAVVRVGGVAFTKRLKIETVKPNRLKINIDVGTDLLEVDQSITAKLQVKWLHGAVAGNLKANMDLRLTPTPTKFKGYNNYVFDDPTKVLYGTEYVLFDGKIDDNGEANMPLVFKTNKSASGMLNANFITRVMEKSGDFSIDMQKVKFAPYSSFVGLKMPAADRGWYLTDRNHKIDITTLSPKGKLINKNNLQLIVYKIGWRWWWDSGNENLASYLSRSSTRVVINKKLKTRNGKTSFQLNIPYRSWRDYGRYLIRVIDKDSGHSAGVTAYFSQWYGRAPEGMLGNANMLSFVADKDKYKVGEEAEITIPSSKEGKALVSIENGAKVLNAFWVDTQARVTKFKVKITPDMAPNAYVSVSLVQPHAQVKNDLPIRLYGVIPLFVENPATRLHPVIDMPNELEPEKQFTVKVSEKNGKPMTYTLAVVDEGLLDLTRFKTPDLWKKFYAREALGVKTWDMYDLVMGAFGARLEKAFAIGGDEDAASEEKTKANRFKSVVKFYGPYTLEAGATKSQKITMPNYIGSVRTMVVAGDKGAYGSTDKTTKVRKPLMVLATLPRVVSPSEEVELPITIFAMDKKVKNVKIKLECNELLQPVDGTTRNISFDRMGEMMQFFKLKVAKKLGIAKVNVVATSGQFKSTYQIELDVRNPNPRVVLLTDKLLKNKETWQTTVKAVGMAGTNKAVLEVSNIPPIDFGRRLQYLIDYPHGCVEQTTSAVFPQLFLNKVVNLTDQQKQEVEKNIKAGVRRLIRFQTTTGGFAYWQGNNDPSDWGTNYAGHFMLCAEEAGYTLPVGLKSQWIKYQQQRAKDWVWNSNSRYNDSELVQAYRLYTLALAGKADLAAMNRLREQTKLTTAAKWRLAATYQLIGKTEVAQSLIAKLQTNVHSYNGYSASFGSAVRDKAMILETLSLMGKKTQAFPLVKELSNTLSSTDWLSTQTTAYCLIAMAQFAGTNKSGLLQFSYAINGKSKQQIKTDKSVQQLNIPIQSGTANLSVTNIDNEIIYTRIISSGIPMTDTRWSMQNNLRLTVKYVDSDGKAVDVGRLKQGTDFQAIVTISNPGTRGEYRNLALTQIFPSGWEILNTRFGDIDMLSNNNQPDYTDIRDDRVYSYFGLKSGETKTFKVKLSATYVGFFYLPTVTCNAMYDNSINACVEGQWVNVVR